jgi:hypothetical protein
VHLVSLPRVNAGGARPDRQLTQRRDGDIRSPAVGDQVDFLTSGKPEISSSTFRMW